MRPRQAAAPGECGFSMLELLVATALLVVLTGGVFALVHPGSGTARAQPELADMQQRLRVVADTLRRDLSMAGAGVFMGPAGGPLSAVFAPILPYATGPLVPATTRAPMPAAITIVYVPPTASQSRLRTQLHPALPVVRVETGAGCPAGPSRAVCGFTAGTRVVVFQSDGAHDVFTVAAVEDDGLRLEHRDGSFTTTYEPGAWISEVVAATYYLHAAERRLYRYDGHRTTLPVADDVVGVRFEYFGEAMPPAMVPAPTGAQGPWQTTYGPMPPEAGTDRPGDDWGPGESCTFALVGGRHVSRLPQLSGADHPGQLVPIELERLGDGPWCPGQATGTGLPLANGFDADLLRVRRIRVTVRVQAASASLRGANPADAVWFVHPGTARRGERFIRDQEVRFEVTPRNLNLAR